MALPLPRLRALTSNVRQSLSALDNTIGAVALNVENALKLTPDIAMDIEAHLRNTLLGKPLPELKQLEQGAQNMLNLQAMGEEFGEAYRNPVRFITSLQQWLAAYDNKYNTNLLMKMLQLWGKHRQAYTLQLLGSPNIPTEQIMSLYGGKPYFFAHFLYLFVTTYRQVLLKQFPVPKTMEHGMFVADTKHMLPPYLPPKLDFGSPVGANDIPKPQLSTLKIGQNTQEWAQDLDSAIQTTPKIYTGGKSRKRSKRHTKKKKSTRKSTRKRRTRH